MYVHGFCKTLDPGLFTPNPDAMHDPTGNAVKAPEGPMTRARIKRFKEQLSLFITSFVKEQEHPKESKMTCVQVIQVLEDFHKKDFSFNSCYFKFM